MQELDIVVLAHDFQEYGLQQGDIGTIVHAYHHNQIFEVEFVTGEGQTLAVLTLKAEDIRLMREQEILHVRTLLAA